jgi:CheY-like chemotaxis protein
LARASNWNPKWVLEVLSRWFFLPSPHSGMNLKIDMETILLVENDADIRESLVELLELRGYQVTATDDGHKALERLETGPLPCLIILDLMLPAMSGWEFRRRQLADNRWSDIPVVLLSGVNNLPQESRRLKAVAFLLKPINFDSLYETIGRYC